MAASAVRIQALHKGAVQDRRDTILALCVAAFDDFDPDYLDGRLPGLIDPILHLAENDSGEALGFKLGYRREPQLLYSWLGGVAPAARRRGVASALMTAQHQWAHDHGYHHVETRTRSINNAMIIANLRGGFNICGFTLTKSGAGSVTMRIALV
ncbi:MAG: GNAT family N-acetyltransferase [Pseudomonadota bacterium]